MTTAANLIKWEFRVNYHVPIALGDVGSVEWAEHSACHEIALPASIENPCDFLGKSGYNDQVDIVDFSDFSKVAE